MFLLDGHTRHTLDPAIGYLRVSTKEQGRSGLGLDAQRAAIESFASREGILVNVWYTEVETGKGSDGPRCRYLSASWIVYRGTFTSSLA